MLLRIHVVIALVLGALSSATGAKPVLYIIGDSTVRNSTGGQMGWGDPLAAHFDPAKIDVVNRAIGGRSSRSFITEGRWDAVMANLKPGDFVLMQFGHNDGGALNEGRCRASIKGIGGETEDIVRSDNKQAETVRTYGWYLKKYIRDTRAKMGVPIVVSPIPRNIWNDGRIDCDETGYGLWAKQTAQHERAHFIDFNRLLAERYTALGPAETGALFAGTDHTHTNPPGAEFNASVMTGAIRSLDACHLAKGLLPGDLWLPAVFSDHMVLQRDMPVPVWGTARPGAGVSVAFADHRATTTADPMGNWRIELPAHPGGGPFTLDVKSGPHSQRVSDVLCGDVWLHCGQTETKGPVDNNGSGRPSSFRVFAAEPARREFPQREVVGRWIPVTSKDATLRFGHLLGNRIQGPVGILHCAVEGSSIEAWTRLQAMEAHPQLANMLKVFSRRKIQFRDDPKAFETYGMRRAAANGSPAPPHPDPVQNPQNPGVLHNAMIAPLVPYAIRGAVWHQGAPEQNPNPPSPLARKILTDDWRALWKNPDLRVDCAEDAAKTTATSTSGS